MKKIILSTILLTTFLISCKKSDSDNPSPGNSAGTNCIPVAALDNHGDTLQSYSYISGTSQISRLQYFLEDNERGEYSLFTYEPGKITEKFYHTDGQYGAPIYYMQDPNGRIIKMTQENIFTSYKDTTLYMYDGNGTLTTSIEKRIGSTSEIDTFSYSYIDSRVEQSKIKNGKPVEVHTYTYTSNDDKAGFNEFILNDLPGKGLFGKISSKLIETDTYQDMKNSAHNNATTFKYELNGNGFPSKVFTKIEGSITYADTTVITYTCR